jgi:hypothetical protein
MSLNSICYNSLINFVSSFSFSISSIYAFYYKNSTMFAQGYFILLLSSILYHGVRVLQLDENLIDAIKVIDMINAHVLICYFTYISFGINIWFFLWICCIIYISMIYFYFNMSYHPVYGYYAHSSIHLVGAIGVIFMIESYLLL